MSERDTARGLAEEIARDIYGTGVQLDLANEITDGRFGQDLDRWEGKLGALLDEREARLQKKLRAAAGDVVEIFLDARPPGTVDLVYDKLARKLGLEDSDAT